MKRLLVLAALIACAAAPATAQVNAFTEQDRQTMQDMQARLNAAPDRSLQAVETLSCDQMYAELSTAGQQMNAQMDPNFAANAQEMYARSQGQGSGIGMGMLSGMGSALACSLPGIGMACGMMMQSQMAGHQQEAAENQQRMAAMASQMNAATQGIDLARMQLVSQRWESEHCEAPQASPPQ